MDNKELQIIELRDNAKLSLEKIKDIDSGTDFIDKIKALETYAKATKQDAEMVKLIQEQKIRSMRILGQLLEKTEFDKGRLKEGPRLSSTTAGKPTLSDYGITKDESSTYQTIAAIPKEVFNEHMDLLKGNESTVQEITITRFKNVGKEFKQAKKINIATREKWPDKELEMKEQIERGITVVINMNKNLHLLKWAQDNKLYIRVDRHTEWGNPFELNKDGDRKQVCTAYANYYFPHKRSLHPKVIELKGKVLGCHCYPLQCHGDFLAIEANGSLKSK